MDRMRSTMWSLHPDWFRAAFEASPVAAALSDSDGHFLAANPAYLSLVGRAWHQLRGRSSREFTHPDDLDQHRDLARRQAEADAAGETLRVEKRYQRPDGTTVWAGVWLTGFTGPDGEQATMAVAQDITERRRTEAALLAEASTDPLTGLLNRRGWTTRLAELERASPRPHPVALAMLDLDHFKTYNDTHGHDAGDALLVRFAGLLVAAVRTGDVVARWGGEEFALALPLCPTENAHARLVLLAERLSPGVRFSAGLTSAHDGEPLTTTTTRADRLLYEAKRDGRDRIAVDPADTAREGPQ